MYRYVIIKEDEYWDYGKTYICKDSDDPGEFATDYMRLKKAMKADNVTIFDHPDYGKGTQKPDKDYFDMIDKWPYVNGFKEKWKRADYDL